MGIFKFLGSTLSRKKKQPTNLLFCACHGIAEEPEIYPYTHPIRSVSAYSKVKCNCGVDCACGGQCTCQEK